MIPLGVVVVVDVVADETDEEKEKDNSNPSFCLF